MKLDSEPVFCHSTLVHKSDSKPFEYNDYALDTAVPKSGNEIVKENQKVISCDLKGHERDADPLDGEDRFWNTSEFDCSINVDDIVNACGNEVRNSVATCAVSSEKLESFEKDGDMCTDKSVTKHELPVCCEESTYHVVKDICIDEGMLSPEKILVENGKEEHEGFCTFLPPDTDKNVDPTKETADKELPLPDGQKASAENDCGKDDNNLCSHKDLMQEEENYDARDKIISETSEEKIVPEDIFLIPELSKENSMPESSEFNGMEIEHQCIQNPNGEAVLENPALVSEAEESDKNSFPNELSYNSKLESGTITFDFGSSTTSMDSGREVSPQNDGCEPPLESQNLPKLEDGSESLPFSGQIQRGLGESSFSAAGPSSALISYSGQITHSGNISLRSDSSTTSTRSFAFPVLQTEWNSSPVRMAKAERRHLRKHRCWRRGILCCRF